MWDFFRRERPAPAPASPPAPPTPPPQPANPMPIADRAWYKQPQVRVAPGDPPRFLVRLGDYYGPILITDDPWKLPMADRMALAFRSLPGAASDPVVVGYDNFTGLMEDDYLWNEWTVAATPAAVVALQAVGLTWETDAETLAARFRVSADAVEAVRADMKRGARERFLEHESDMGRIRQGRSPDAPAPGSADDSVEE